MWLEELASKSLDLERKVMIPVYSFSIYYFPIVILVCYLIGVSGLVIFVFLGRDHV